MKRIPLVFLYHQWAWCCSAASPADFARRVSVVIDDVAPDDLRYVGFCLHDLFVEARRRWYQQPGNELHLGAVQRWKVRIAGVAAVEYRPAVAAVLAIVAAPGVEAMAAIGASQPEVLAVAAVMEELEQIWARPSAEERVATDVIGTQMSEVDHTRFFGPPTTTRHSPQPSAEPHPLQP
jgi:hypothetical protein